MGGQKIKKLAEILIGRCKDTICTCGKNFIFFFKNLNLCAISKVALYSIYIAGFQT
jgi:hypothetical protein